MAAGGKVFTKTAKPDSNLSQETNNPKYNFYHLYKMVGDFSAKEFRICHKISKIAFRTAKGCGCTSTCSLIDLRVISKFSLSDL